MLISKLTNRLLFFIEKIKFAEKQIFFRRGAYAENTIFEGSNRLGYKSKIYNSSVGFGTYIGAYNLFDNARIGKYCSIANNIYVDLGSHPVSEFVSTSPIFYSVDNQSVKGFDTKRPQVNKFEENQITDSGYNIEIGNDVWLCSGARLKQGVKIGDGAIVASGAVVTKDVPPYCVVAGVPARVIKKRFNENQIDFLVNLQWWNKDRKWLDANFDKFHDINSFIE